MSSEEEKRKAYVNEKQLHHLFELLAAKTLQERPENVFKFLRDQLNHIEESESNAKVHDPSKIVFKGDNADQLKITIAVFGIDNAGKTALIHAMGGQVEHHTTPTVGFSPTHFETPKFKLCVFDLGGGKNFRAIWPHYYHDAHAIIYVMDSADEKRFAENASVFYDVVSHKYVAGKPLLIFANKKDLAGARKDPSEIKDILQMDADTRGGEVKVVSCCALELHDEETNKDIDQGTDWLLSTVQKNYTKLNGLVESHSKQVQEEKKRRLEELRRAN